jgi:creatinine amidohydrolase
MLWMERSWPQIDATPRATPVIVPLGSCEQHGHHLPVGVDTFQVDAIARRVETPRRDRVLLTPTLWLGSSHHHLDFPGTLSIRPSVYSDVLMELARSILRAGFTRIFFLNGHGGNETPAAQALSELVATDDAADAASLAFASWWQITAPGLDAEALSMTTPRISHACEYETSLMMFLHPDLVAKSPATDAPLAIDTPWHRSDLGGRVAVFHRFHRLTASGSMGAPSQATAAKGEGMVDRIVEQVGQFIDDFATWPSPPPIGPRKA